MRLQQPQQIWCIAAQIPLSLLEAEVVLTEPLQMVSCWAVQSACPSLWNGMAACRNSRELRNCLYSADVPFYSNSIGFGVHYREPELSVNFGKALCVAGIRMSWGRKSALKTLKMNYFLPQNIFSVYCLTNMHLASHFRMILILRGWYCGMNMQIYPTQNIFAIEKV